MMKWHCGYRESMFMHCTYRIQVSVTWVTLKKSNCYWELTNAESLNQLYFYTEWSALKANCSYCVILSFLHAVFQTCSLKNNTDHMCTKGIHGWVSIDTLDRYPWSWSWPMFDWHPNWYSWQLINCWLIANPSSIVRLLWISKKLIDWLTVV